MYVYAAPTHPEDPDGENVVTVTYYARDDKSGIGESSYRLKDSQGNTHHFWSYHRNFYSIHFDGDPTAWEKYTFTTILPQENAHGIWELAEIWMSNKGKNGQTYNFEKKVFFEHGNSNTNYTLYASLDENEMLTLDFTSDTEEGYGYQYRVICDSTGQEINDAVPAGENSKKVIDISDWNDGKIIVIAQMLDKEGNVIAVRSRTLIKSDETWKSIDISSEAYQNYVTCYENGMAVYQQMTEEKTTNSSEAAQILSDIELLKGKITESKMTDEDKTSFLVTLNKETQSVSALQAENDGIFDGNAFYEKVQANSEAVAAFNGRIAQYAERMKTVATIEMLNILKAEIEQDTENFETAYLNPVMNNCQDLEQKKPRLGEIAEELEDCKAQIQTYEVEVDVIIARIALAEKQAEMKVAHQKTMDVYEEYMSYYEGDGMEFYQQVTEAQVTNSTTAVLILSM